MNQYVNSICSFIDGKRDEMISILRDFVNIESHFDDLEGLQMMAARLKTEFEKEGFVCRTISVGEGRGEVLVGTLGAERGGKPVIFSGHMDTVFKRGTFGANPFRVEGEKAYGPGVLDMKGGIVIALYAVKALNDIGYNQRPIKILFAGDEETLHKGANTAEVFLEEAKGGLCAFNMETGLIDGEICIARKGKTEVTVSVAGVSAHAGNDYLSGRNAIIELCQKAIEIQNLTNLDAGTTVSVGTIHGGTMSGAVPDYCEAAIDLRATKVSEMEKVKNQVEEVCEKTFIHGTTTSFHYTMEMLPYETTDDVLKLHAFVKKIAEENGFGSVGAKKLGGSSDASYITIANTPAICSCGVRGQWNHTDKEFAVVESLYERAKLWAAVVFGLGEGQLFED